MALEEFTAKIIVDTEDATKNVKVFDKTLKDQIKTLSDIQKHLVFTSVRYIQMAKVIESVNTSISKMEPAMIGILEVNKTMVVSQKGLQKQLVATEKATVDFGKSTNISTSSLSTGIVALNSTVNLLEKSFAALAPVTAAGFLLKATGAFEILGGSVTGVVATVNGARSDFFKLAKTINGSFIPGIVGAAQDSLFLGSVLVALGAFAKDSEDSFIQLTGVIAALAGLLVGSFGAAVVFATNALGNFLNSIGDQLIDALVKYQQQAIKAESVTKQFAFTISGFINQLGTEAVGSLDSWNQQINTMVDTTVFGANEIQESIRLLVSEGARLGLTVDDNQKLLKRSADLAASTGKDLQDVTQRLLSAMTGNAAAALALGIDVRESALAHSDLAHESDLTVSKLSDQQKTLLRLSEIFHQTNPIVGAAAEELNTVAGSTAFVTKQYNDFQIAVGQAGVLTTGLIKIKQKLLGVILDLPKGLLDLIGTLGDMSAILFKTSGAIIGLIFPIATFANVLNLSNVIIGQSATAQKLLNRTFEFLSRNIGATIVPVTGLTTAFKNLVNVMKTGLIVSLKSFGASLVSISASLKAFLVPLIPLTIKLALLVTLAFAVSEAVSELFNELDVLRVVAGTVTVAFNDILSVFSKTSDQSKGLLDILGSLISSGFQRMFRVVVELSKILITGLVAGLIAAGRAVLTFKQLFAEGQDEIKGLQDQLDAFDSSLAQMTENMVRSTSNIFDLVTGAEIANAALNKTSGAVTKTGNSLKDQFINRIRESAEALGLVTPKAEEFARTLKQIQDENVRLEAGINVIGKNEIDKIEILTKAELKRLELRENELKTKGLINKEIQKELNLQSQLIAKSGAAQIDQKRLDVVKSLVDGNRQLFEDQENFGKSGIDLINIQLKQSLRNIALKRQELEVAGLLTEEAERQLEIREQLELDKAAKSAESLSPKLIPNESIDQMKNAFGGVFAEGAQTLSNGVGSAFLGPIAAAQSVIGAAQGLVDLIPNLLNSISGLFNSITNLPLVIADAFLGLFDSVTDLVANFIPNIVNAFTDIVAGFGEFLAQGLPQALADLPVILLDALLNLVDNLPSIITNLAIGFLNAIIVGIPKLIVGLIKAIPVLIKALIKSIPLIIKELAKGFVDIGKELANTVLSLFGTGLNRVGRQAEQSFKVLGEKLTGATSQLFEVIEGTAVAKGTDTTDRIRDSIKAGVNWLQAFWDRTFGRLSVYGILITLQDFWDKTFGSLSMHGLAVTLQTFWDKTFGALSVSGIATTLQSFWDKTFGALSVSGIATTLQSFWDKTFGSVSVSGIATSLQDFWDKTFGALSVSGIATTLQEFWNRTFGSVSVSGIVALLQQFWDTTFGQAGDFFKKLGTNIWNGLKDGLANLGDIFNGLSLNGLREKFRDLFRQLDPSNLLSKMFKFDGGGKGTVEKLLNIDVPFVAFAEGGFVPGKANVPGDSLKNDNVLAFLSPGELVIPRSITQDKTMMTAMMTAMSQAGKIPKFGLGGFVKAIARGDLGTAKKEAAGTVKPPTSIRDVTDQLKDGADALGGVFNSVEEALVANAAKIQAKMVEGLRKMIRATTAGITPDVGGVSLSDALNVGTFKPGFDKGVIDFLSTFKNIGLFQNGGAVVGTDTVPALLTPGEFIVSAGSANAIGIDALRQMNQTGSMGGSGTTNVVEFQSGAFQISVTADNFDESFVRGTMMEMIKEELREATSNGENVINQSGVF